jgi:hypothetical protein
MADKRKSILVRISPELWDALNRWARDELRSVNAQIEYVLREAVRKRRGVKERGLGARDSGLGSGEAGRQNAE